MDKLQQLRREYVKDMPRKTIETKTNKLEKGEEIDYSNKMKDLLLSLKSNQENDKA